MQLVHLVEALGAKGYKILRSATHLKFFQPRSSSIEEKRHEETIPDRNCKVQSDHYDRHENANFCFSLAEGLYVLGSILGEEAVIISPVW